MKSKYCIFGTGGFAKEVLACLLDSKGPDLNEQDVLFMVTDEHFEEPHLLGITVIKQTNFLPTEYSVVVAVGDPNIRQSIVEQLPDVTEYTSIIHPNAVISNWVDIGLGSIVTAGSILTADIGIGQHAHLNLNTTIGHDCQIGDYFTTAPGTNISGHCMIGNRVYLGTNSSVRQGVKICDDVTIGMGAVVVKDILEPGVYVGNPAQKMSKD